jgi:tetratricopeptide (TPR) repeat protein
METMILIPKLKHLLKRGLLFTILFSFVFTACGFSLPPQIKERLAHWPWIGRYFEHPKPPQELRIQAQKALEEALLEGGPEYARQKFEAAQKAFEQGEKQWQEERYALARQKYQEALKLAQEAAQKAQQERQKKKKECWLKYERLKSSLEGSEEMKLRYLKALIEQEEFGKFEEEYRKIIQQKRGLTPPSQSPRKEKT